MKQFAVYYRAVVILGLLAAISIGCTSKSSTPTATPLSETRIVEVTRQVEVTVVVTATPIPTPAYVSTINAAPGTLVYPLSADPLTLDPQEAYDPVSLLVTAQLYEGLFNLRGDGTIAPAAATGFIASAEGAVYTVTLRAGMTWSDGRPLIAQHYADGACRLLDPAVGSPFAYLLTEVAPVQGAAAFASGDLADCAQVGITAVDDLTLRITLARPVAYFPALLASHIFWPARLDASPATANTSLTPTVQSAIPNPQSATTNGPYLLAEHVPGAHITLAKNPAYWNAAQVAIARVEFPIVPDPARQLALYEAGDLQVAESPLEGISRIQADAGFARELHVLPQPGVSYLGLNTQITPTNDINVRQAIASALDREALIEEVLGQPWHVPARGVIPPGIAGHQGQDTTIGYPYDLEAAQRFLVDAGYGPEKPLPPVELWYNREGNNDALFKAVADMLEEAGIPVRLVASGWTYYLDALNTCSVSDGCSHNLYRMGWVMDHADGSSMLRVFRSGAAYRYTGWASAEYDGLLLQAAGVSDANARAALYRQAERLLLDDAVVVPLQYYDRVVLVKDGLTTDYPLFGPPQLQYWQLR